MKTLDLNQLNVESFDVGNPDLDGTQAITIAPIISTDQVPHCDGPTGDC